MKIYCYADGDEYKCEYGSGTYVLGEVHGTRLVTFAPLEFLQEEYPDADITQELIEAAAHFAVQEGYIAETYAED